jgi:uncharacterized sulfatase
MDETYDIIRCVRDKRFKYIRNFKPGRPYAQYIGYMELMPTMQEMRRLNKAGELVGPQKLYFLPEKPEEELYDTVADPHEINNLAARPEHRQRLSLMRKILADHMEKTKDLGLIPEEELNERMRPGGEWATTAKPVLARTTTSADGSSTVELTCPTEGASIAYAIGAKDESAWKLYAGAVRVPKGKALRTRACRLGYKDSPVAHFAAADLTK